jgi:hypothetical protein
MKKAGPANRSGWAFAGSGNRGQQGRSRFPRGSILPGVRATGQCSGTGLSRSSIRPHRRPTPPRSTSSDGKSSDGRCSGGQAAGGRFWDGRSPARKCSARRLPARKSPARRLPAHKSWERRSSEGMSSAAKAADGRTSAGRSSERTCPEHTSPGHTSPECRPQGPQWQQREHLLPPRPEPAPAALHPKGLHPAPRETPRCHKSMCDSFLKPPTS